MSHLSMTLPRFEIQILAVNSAMRLAANFFSYPVERKQKDLLCIDLVSCVKQCLNTYRTAMLLYYIFIGYIFGPE